MSHDDHHNLPPAPLDLLDEYWFFSNTLNSGANKKKKPPLLPKSPSTSASATASVSASAEQGLLGCRRRLLRTPSLPAPRIIPVVPNPNNKQEEEEEQAEEEVDDDDLNWSSIYEGILRTRITASSSHSHNKGLQRAPSMPVVPSSDHHSGHFKEKEITPSSNSKLRHSYSTLERHTNSKQQQTPRSSGRSKQKNQQPAMMMVRSKSALFHAEAPDKNKWKRSSDLESIEVQGFKDLGFVFDKEELREDLADVLPGLSKNATSGHGAVRRPYLSEAWHHGRRPQGLIRMQSEAWHHGRRPPGPIRVQSSEARSAAEMKDQLRMWAQAVACNVRQECV